MQLAEPTRMIRTRHGSFAVQQAPNQWMLGYLEGRKARKLPDLPDVSGSKAYVFGFWCGYRSE